MPRSQIMPNIEPFRGVLYNPKNIKISKVVAPPYDVIPPDMQNALYREDKHNIIRIILGKEEIGDSDLNNKYTRAAQFFNNWLKEKVLVQDETPAVYIYSQEYLQGGRKKIGWGFLARMEIEDPKKNRVLPHENTFAKPKQDRLNLIRQVKANLSPVFTLFEDDHGKIERLLKNIFRKKPLFDVKKDGVRNKFWRVDDKEIIKKIAAGMRDKDIFIADGHHRFEVARMYREEMQNKAQSPKPKAQSSGKAGYNYVMMYFAPLDEKGLTILATHRLLKGIDIDVDELLGKLKEYFDIKTVKDEKQLFKKMSPAKKNEYVFGVCFKNRPFYLLKLKKGIDIDNVIKDNRSKEWKRLDVSILHGIIFDNIMDLQDKISHEEGVVYTRDPNYAISEVKKGNCTAVFFLNPTKVDQVRDIAKIGDKMPHKSTYFYPKLLSGLVINKHS
jgi:uncharacterized protein (DUF1015 family)